MSDAAAAYRMFHKGSGFALDIPYGQPLRIGGADTPRMADSRLANGRFPKRVREDQWHSGHASEWIRVQAAHRSERIPVSADTCPPLELFGLWELAPPRSSSAKGS